MLEFVRRNQVLLSAGLFLCISFSLLTLNRGDVRRVDPLGVVFLEIVRPVQGFASESVALGRRLWASYVRLVDVEAENDRLRTALELLEAEQDRVREVKRENERLGRLLDVRRSIFGHAIGAGVIGQDASAWFQTFTVNRGTNDGIEPEMAVIAAGGVVGRVAQTSPNAARVLLVTDHVSGVDALIQRTRARGIVEGSIGGECRMKYLKAGEDVRIGDVAVTSGLDAIFPKGLEIGRVAGIAPDDSGLFHVAIVVPAVDFSTVEEVLIVLAVDEVEEAPFSPIQPATPGVAP